MGCSGSAPANAVAAKKAEAPPAMPKPPNFGIPKCQDDEYAEIAWGLKDFGKKIEPFSIPRPKVFGKQVKVDLLWSGICHTDCHMGHNDWGVATYPMVPGHELCGVVTEVGPEVTKFQVGDNVGIGCFVDSCQECASCKRGAQNYCHNTMVQTYAATKTFGRVGGNQQTKTFGGYSGSNVVHEDYVIKFHDGMDLQKAAPLLCAGITMYTPLKRYGAMNGGQTIGIIGIGGLGTMGIKLAKALGNKVVAVSTSNKKEALARSKGADEFVVSKDPESIKKHALSCDLLLNTVAVAHDLSSYMPLLNKEGTMVMIGAFNPQNVNIGGLIFSGQSVAGSIIGGIPDTQAVVDLCHEHNIYPDCEVIEAK